MKKARKPFAPAFQTTAACRMGRSDTKGAAKGARGGVQRHGGATRRRPVAGLAPPRPRWPSTPAGSSSKDQSGPGQARGGFMAAARSVPGANAGGAPGASTVARLPGTGAAASNNEQGPAANAQACVPPRVRACVGTQSRAPGVGHSRMHGQRQGGVMARASFSGLGLTCAVCGTAWRGAIQRRRRAQ